MKVILEKREKDGCRLGYNEQYINVYLESGQAGDLMEVIGTKENLKLKNVGTVSFMSRKIDSSVTLGMTLIVNISRGGYYPPVQGGGLLPPFKF